MVRSGRSPRLTPTACAAACGGSASAEATAAVMPAEAPKNLRRECFRSGIQSPSLFGQSESEHVRSGGNRDVLTAARQIGNGRGLRRLARLEVPQRLTRLRVYSGKATARFNVKNQAPRRG